MNKLKITYDSDWHNWDCFAKRWKGNPPYYKDMKERGYFYWHCKKWHEHKQLCEDRYIAKFVVWC